MREGRFYHSKGFLCNGSEFVGDWEATPGFNPGDLIGVRLDLAKASLSFTVNGKRVPGSLEGLSSTVSLRSSCYLRWWMRLYM